MNKLTQPVPGDDELFGPELSEAEMEAWIARNRDAINESLREARQEFAEGDVEVLRIVDGRRDLSALFSELR